MYNQLTILGRMTREPEAIETQSGTMVVKGGVATNHGKSEEPMFIDFVAFNRTGEIIKEYVGRGDVTFMTGRLQLRRWEDDEGNRRSKYELVVDRVVLMPRGTGSSGAEPAGEKKAGEAPEGDIPF